MRRKTAVILAAAVLAVLAAIEISLGATFPAKAPGMVTDAANIIPPDKEAALEQAVRDYERKTSIEIAVVTVRSLEGLAPEDYAQELGTKWGVGKRGRDNGVLLLLAVAERKIRIHTGYGIEPDLTDAAAGRVIKEKMAPLLKKGSEDWGAGLSAGVQGIIAGLGEKPYGARVEERNKPKPSSDSLPAETVIFLVIIGVGATVVFVVFFVTAVSGGSSSSRSSRRSSGRSPSSRSSRKSRDDDDDGTLTGIIIGSLLSGGGGGSGSGSSSGGSDSGGGFDFGGGGFGGGGATGDF